MMTDLIERLRAHAEAHEHVAPQDDEQQQWMLDLREAADRIERLIRERDALAKDAQPEHQPASEQADGWPTGLLSRVKAAAERVQSNHAPRRIPADPTDVDLVLGEVQAMLEGRRPPFWVAGPAEAQIEAAAYERAAQQCLLIASGVEDYTQYYEACSDCADAIRTLAAKERPE
jgi:hypothetical protein